MKNGTDERDENRDTQDPSIYALEATTGTNDEATLRHRQASFSRTLHSLGGGGSHLVPQLYAVESRVHIWFATGRGPKRAVRCHPGCETAAGSSKRTKELNEHGILTFTGYYLSIPNRCSYCI